MAEGAGPLGKKKSLDPQAPKVASATGEDLELGLWPILAAVAASHTALSQAESCLQQCILPQNQSERGFREERN